jgi:hypothetical protein
LNCAVKACDPRGVPTKENCQTWTKPQRVRATRVGASARTLETRQRLR